MSNPLHPWSRQERESAKAFSAFTLFLETGPNRSVAGVASKCGKSVSLLWRWSARHGWLDRAREWDTFQAAEKARQLLAKEIESRLRRARHGELVEVTGVRAIQKIAAEVAAGTRQLSVTEAAQLASVGSRMDREALQAAPGVSVSVNVGQPAPPPVVSEEVAMRVALAFIWQKHPDPEVQEVARKACNALATGRAHA